METASPQLIDFLSHAAPFENLSADALNALVSHTSIIYLSAQNVSSLIPGDSTDLYLIENGQFTVKKGQGSAQHLSDGDFFNYSAQIDDNRDPLSISVDEAGLVYIISAEGFNEARQNADVEVFFRTLESDTLQSHALQSSNSMWLYKPLHEAITQSPITTPVDTTIHGAAQIMSQHGVSSLLIVNNNKLAGIVTDRDLRNRVVAAAVDVTLPVREVMTPAPAMIDEQQTLFDAMTLMTERNIHHLPVTRKNTHEPVGIITASDVIRLQRANVLFIIGELVKASSLYELSRLAWQIPHYFASHAKRPGDFDIAGKVLSQATDIMTRKLIDFYCREHGEAPVKWCWLVYGSQAREDQTMGSDQDNGLLLADTPDSTQSGWFEGMAEYVCKGLAKCGIKLCDGNIMASNPALRLSLSHAVREAQQWVSQPTPAAILEFNIFLDVRPVAGDRQLFEALQKARLPLFSDSIFLAALARSTADMAVPLSMFQKFVFSKKAPVNDGIDIKTGAVAIINNLARLYALAAQLSQSGTVARFNALPADSYLSQRDARNLKDIWLFLGRLRWRHQLTNNTTDNFIRVSQLSSIEKHQLKAAFKTIARAQQAAIMHFSGGMG